MEIFKEGAKYNNAVESLFEWSLLNEWNGISTRYVILGQSDFRNCTWKPVLISQGISKSLDNTITGGKEKGKSTIF